MVLGNKIKRGRKKEKEGRSFGKLPSFFFPPFLFVFLTVFLLMVLLRCGDFGPNLVVFLCFKDSISFESLKFLIKITICCRNSKLSWIDKNLDQTLRGYRA